METPHQLSELQIAIMRVLWSRGEATVVDVHNALQRERGLAMTTVATVLSRLEKRGFLAHRTEGRQFVYRATVSEDQVRRSMVAEIAERLFEGDITELVSHLISGRELSADDLAQVKKLIESRERDVDAPGGKIDAPDGEERHE